MPDIYFGGQPIPRKAFRRITMSLTTCTIHVTQRQEKVIYLTSELARSLKLSRSKSVNLQLGSKNVFTGLRLLKKTGNHLYVPTSIISQLRIPHIGSCMILSHN